MFSCGQIVYSKCGRDKGKIFLIFDFDDSYVFLTDGDSRLIKNPKKKKIKHIQITNTVIDDLKKKFEQNSYVLDAEIRKVLKPYKNQCNM